MQVMHSLFVDCSSQFGRFKNMFCKKNAQYTNPTAKIRLIYRPYNNKKGKQLKLLVQLLFVSGRLHSEIVYFD